MSTVTGNDSPTYELYHIYLQIDLFHDIDEENKNEKVVLPDPSKKKMRSLTIKVES